MSPSKSVSVVIPVRNGEKTIGKTLKSLLNQSDPPMEIIIVDDGSTDQTFKEIKNIQSTNKTKIEIKFFQNEKNLGPAAARNRGTKEARGEFIFYTDSDCFVTKDWLKKIAKEYTSEDIGGVGGYLKPGEKTLVAFLENLHNKYLIKIGNKKVVGYKECPTGYTNAVTYRKKVLKDVGGFDEGFKYASGEDIDLKKRVCEKGYRLIYIPEPIIHLDKYNLDYLLSRIITRALNRPVPKKTLARLLFVMLNFHVATFNVLRKIKKYKKEGLFT